MLVLPLIPVGVLAMFTWLTMDWSLFAEQQWTFWRKNATIEPAPSWEIEYWVDKLLQYQVQAAIDASAIVRNTQPMAASIIDGDGDIAEGARCEQHSVGTPFKWAPNEM